MIARHVLEHFDAAGGRALLQAMHAALAPQGRAIVEVPNMANFVTAPYARWFDYTHRHGYTTESLTAALRAAGFEVSACFGVRRAIGSAADAVAYAAQSLTGAVAWALPKAQLSAGPRRDGAGDRRRRCAARGSRGGVTRTAIALIGQRRQALASVGTRLALGAYPLAFVVVFGWAYGKDAFDLAAAAGNWAAYLNVFVLAGFALVPPAVALLRGDAGRMAADRAIVRNHIALARWLPLAAVATALGLAVTIDGVFPELAARGGARLQCWYACFALLALTQVPATLWLGVVQAAGRHAVGLAAIALPRLLAVLAVPACKAAGASASWSIGAVTAIVLVGQVWLAAAGRRALCAIDPQLLRERSDAAAVLWPNISGAAVTLVGAMVSIVPVTIVGYLHTADVGLAQVAVGVSNAVGAVFVAAFFPASLALAQGVPSRSALRRYSLGLARRIAAGTAAALALV